GTEQFQISPQANSESPGHFSFATDERQSPSGATDNGQQHAQADNQNDSSAKTDTADIEPISITQTELSLGAGNANFTPAPEQPATPPNATPRSSLRNAFKEEIIEQEAPKPKPKVKASIAGLASPFKAMAMATQTLVGFAVPALKSGKKENTDAPAPAPGTF